MKSYAIRQKITVLANQYAVYELDGNGNDGPMVAFAQQKRFAFKESFTMYTDDSKQAVSFTVKARQVLDFGARYDVTDAAGNLLGTLGKDFKSSLLRSTWHVFSPGQEDKPLLVVQERDQGIAILRRVWDFLPIVSDIPFFIKYHFDMLDPDNNQVAATYDKTTTVRDYYKLDIVGGAAESIDPRVLISAGVLLDAMQGR